MSGSARGGKLKNSSSDSYAASLNVIREDLLRFDRTLETLVRDKVDRPIFQEQLYRKADIRLLNDKADLDRVVKVEKNVQTVLKELDGIKRQHEEELKSVKEQLQSSMENFAAVQAAVAQQQLDESSVLTKGMCIGCGRPATAHRIADSRPYSPSQDILQDGSRPLSRSIASPLKPLRIATASSIQGAPQANPAEWDRMEPMDDQMLSTGRVCSLICIWGVCFIYHSHICCSVHIWSFYLYFKMARGMAGALQIHRKFLSSLFDMLKDEKVEESFQ
jgi:hypothetical protein